MAEIQLKHVTKIYEGGSAAVRDFNLEIHEREFVIFVGPSGCGKSTTLRMIAGLEEITEGELYVDGEYMNDVESCDRDMAMVFQNYALYPHMTVFDNIAYSMKLKKSTKRRTQTEKCWRRRRSSESRIFWNVSQTRLSGGTEAAGSHGTGDRKKTQGISDGRAPLEFGRQAEKSDEDGDPQPL